MYLQQGFKALNKSDLSNQKGEEISEGSSSGETSIASKEFILVAEDSAPNRTILCHLIIKLGFGIIECHDGKMAWEQLNRSEEERGKIIAIISDIMMPQMDGVELLKKVRESDNFNKIPFVLVTAVADKEYIIEAKKLGVDGYVLKPITFQRVLHKLNELFPDRKLTKLQQVG